MTRRYIYPLSAAWLPSQVGSKATNLRFLLRQRCKAPAGWVVLWTAREDSLGDLVETRRALLQELNKIIDPRKSYAVRSSASVEDAGDFSCAGLFRSFLEVRGAGQVARSIENVWASLDSMEFDIYGRNIIRDGENTHTEDASPQMAVIIQEMVPARFSGVVFTKNPVTGLSETIIEAGEGTGESQAETHASPERWIRKWGNWTEKPSDSKLDEGLALEIANQANRISKKYGKPADLEWAWDGETLYFLQIRPITRLDIPVYSNRIAREMLPGVIKPLVWSVNTSLINPTWTGILERLTGQKDWNPESLTGHYYYRAYFNMGIFARVFERLGMPGEALELLFGLEQEGPEKPHMRPGPGVIRRLPGLAAFALSFAGIHGRLNRLVREKKPVYEDLARRMEKDDREEWLALAAEIFRETKEVAYYNIMIPMLAMMHHRMLSGMLKRHGADIRQIELHGAAAAAEKYNPQNTLARIHERYFSSNSEERRDGGPLSPETEERLQAELQDFLREFGHFSDSGNDCSSIPWRETPDLVRRMVERPQQRMEKNQESVSFKDLKLSGMTGFFVKIVFRRAGRFAVAREEISSLYTFGYGQFRTCFAKMGAQFVRRGVLDDKEDIYYLYLDELKELAEEKNPKSRKELVNQRRKEIESFKDSPLPEMILGSDQPPVLDSENISLRGIPTSLGTYSGPARVVRGIADFEKVLEGDVLVIPYSDVGWTPLFAKAGAVVAESGGVLSHSSIVAREYRIPAVVSVAGACRLKDGTRMMVNGYTGDIVIDEGEDA